jgi:serine/threonine protein phosphatase PrpC
MVAELVRSGCVRPENATRHINRHLVTNAIGGNFAELLVEVRKLDLEPQDVLLVCSDGLTDMLSNDRITAILKAEQDPKNACERMVKEANGEGGRDNITATVARFDEAK